LLRAIQEKAVLRVGGDTQINVDVRIIAATNQDLLELVGQGRFRADLYYRLNVVRISIPSLKERAYDIKILFEHFIKEMSPRFNKHIVEIDSEVMKCLKTYHWPGNIRELQNVLERTLMLAEDGHITVECLPREVLGFKYPEPMNRYAGEYQDFMASPQAVSNRSTRKLQDGEQEKEKIIRTLDGYVGNVSKTAAVLGMSRATLYRKMKRYDITN
jgi:two-component system, NtrC family, response regulator HydG